MSGVAMGSDMIMLVLTITALGRGSILSYSPRGV